MHNDSGIQPVLRPLTVACLMTLAAPAALQADVANLPAHEAMGTASVSRATYSIPPIELVRSDGRSVALSQELDDGRPVIMNFIFTTCETTCPLSSATFSALQKELRADVHKVHLVSISIDPEQDTPVRLRAYAKRFGAGPEWQFYTGTLAASLSAQQAFNAYRGDKMSHTPLTLMRAGPGRAWLRIEGFATPDQLLQQYHELLTEP